MKNKPYKWVAAVLALISPPLGMLYVARLALAAIYLVAGLGIGMLIWIYLHRYPLVSIMLNFAYVIVGIIHSYRLASLYPAEKSRPRYSRWYGLPGIYLGVFAVVFGFRAFLFEPFRFPSGSMIPTIEPGSNMLVQKWGYGHYGSYGLLPFQRPISSGLQRGELIVFDYPGDKEVQYAKRLIGLPGDKIEYRNKQISINGIAVPQHREGEYFNSVNGGSPELLTRFVESIEGRDYSIVLNNAVTRDFPDAISFLFREKCNYEPHAVTCVVPAGHYYVMGDNRDNSNDSRYWGFVPADHVVGKVLYILR